MKLAALTFLRTYKVKMVQTFKPNPLLLRQTSVMMDHVKEEGTSRSGDSL